MFSAFLVEYNVRLTEIKLKRYWGSLFFKTSKKSNVFCVNEELEGSQIQVLDIFSLFLLSRCGLTKALYMVINVDLDDKLSLRKRPIVSLTLFSTLLRCLLNVNLTFNRSRFRICHVCCIDWHLFLKIFYINKSWKRGKHYW